MDERDAHMRVEFQNLAGSHDRLGQANGGELLPATGS